jgi:hypothetical protein
MPAPEARLTWTQTAPESGEVNLADCGAYDFEIRATLDRGSLALAGADPAWRLAAAVL